MLPLSGDPGGKCGLALDPRRMLPYLRWDHAAPMLGAGHIAKCTRERAHYFVDQINGGPPTHRTPFLHLLRLGQSQAGLYSSMGMEWKI
eukprot:9490532-Pyramimonas_sp.AAC.1